MNLIEDIAERDKDERALRMKQFDLTILVMSHEGDVAPAGGFDIVRARTLKEFANAEPKRIYAFDGEDTRLCEVIVAAQDVFGFNIRLVESFPDQHSNAEIDAILASLPRVDFLRLLGDIADQRLLEESMTEAELSISRAKKQHSERVNKEGEIKPLMDFDRSFTDEDLSVAPPNGE